MNSSEPGTYLNADHEYIDDVLREAQVYAMRKEAEEGRARKEYAEECMKQFNQEVKRMEGNKPIVICGGMIENCKDLDEAQRKAEELAHKHGANAYILKPVKMVAPKRDVVVTDLP